MNLTEYLQYHETKAHGTAQFPYNTYLCSIPLDFARVPLHWHDDMELIYVKKGRGRVRLDLAAHDVEAGCIAVVGPGRLHAIEGAPGGVMEYENIIFSLSLLDAGDDWCRRACLGPLRAGTLRPPAVLRPGMPYYAQAAAALDAADAACAAKPAGYPLTVKGQLLVLLQALFAAAQDAVPAAPAHGEAILKAALAHLETHFAEPLEVSDMARLCCCSEAHFMRCFKAAMGVPFVAYRNRLRLAAAARLLEETDQPVLEAAAACGFENISYFNRCFRARYGMAPRAYRRSAQKPAR